MDDHGSITFAAECGWPSQFSEGDRAADLPAREVRYCNQVAGHGDAHEHVPDDDPRSYDSTARKIRCQR